ncbi:MAG: alpha/beta hydrolase [Saccharofermentans sp.]|nr:alpha/beta hydrolase [Saccharofermentans sp.]
MSDMSFGNKVLFCVASALLASSVAGFVLMLLSPRLTGLIAVICISALVCSGIFFGISQLLRDKEAKISIPSKVGVVVISLIIMFSTVLINLAPIIVFPVNHDEAAYNELKRISENEESRVSEIKTDDLTGWRISAKNVKDTDPRPVVLCFLGNGMNSSATTLMVYQDNESKYAPFTDDTDYVCIDYPGYGISGGVPTDSSIKEMALKVFDEVSSWSTTSEVIAFGYSIGTGAAVYLASEREVAGLVVWAPYANSYDFFNNYLDIFHGPVKLLVRIKIDSDKYIKKVTCPIMIIASDKDEVIPYQSSRDLFAAANGSASDFVTVSGIGHNDFWRDDKVLTNTYDFIGEVA